MKNLFKLFAVVLCLCFSLPALAEEKINNFEVHFDLHENNTATVTEYITFTSEHNQIKRGLYRTLSKDIGENIKVESLTLDGNKHPYNTEDGELSLQVNFGIDDFLEVGEHTYIFTYTLNKVMETTFLYDVLIWPVTGGSWTLPIDKASFYLKIPYSVKPITKKIITDISGDKIQNVQQIEENIFSFEAVRPLKEKEFFSIYFPVKKGIFKFKWYEIKYVPVFVCALIIIYYFIIWYLVGRDPEEKRYPTRFSPPKNVSAGFVSYFLNGPFSPKNLATVLASLIVKKKIKIIFQKWKAPECEKINNAYGDLEEDEIRLMMSLPSDFKLNKDAYPYLEKGLISINYYYENKIGDYVIDNFFYMLFPIIAFIGILFYFHNRGVIPPILLGLVLNFLVPIIICVYTRNIKKFILLILLLLLGTGIGISSVLSPRFLLNLNVIAVIITVFMTALFTYLVNNLMLDGAVLRDELSAFKRYMSIAERDRVALSDPSVAGKIFCDYLPYAYAFGIESEWFDKFKNKIDFRLQDTYGSLTTSTALNVGLFVTISLVMNTGRKSGLGGGFGGLGGKGGLGGGGGR